MTASSDKWVVYMLECADGTLYTGITTDLEKRVATHNAGKGARYTRGRLPVRPLYSEPCADHRQALRREIAIKRLSATEKRALILKRKRKTRLLSSP